MKISPQSLDLAVAQGVLTVEQADRLRALEAEKAGAVSEERQDDEKLRFIGGFGDVFVTIGIALLLGSSAWFAQAKLGVTWMWAVTAALSWLLAEYFTRRRRMALPSIALVLSFVGLGFPRPSPLLWRMRCRRAGRHGCPTMASNSCGMRQAGRWG